MRVWILSGVVLSILVACQVKQELPPALPEERVVFTPPLAAPQAPPAPEPSALAHGVPVSDAPVVTPTPAELRAFTAKPGKALREKPEAVITMANTKSTITPSTSGYADGRSALQHYPYLPGRLYEVYSSPNNPT